MSATYKMLLAEGVLSVPFINPPEAVAAARTLVSDIAPEGSPPPMIAELRGLTIVQYFGEFYIYDQVGYLCATNRVEGLMTLLAAENRPSSDSFPNGARRLLSGTAPSKIGEAFNGLPTTDEQIATRARVLAAQMRDRLAAGPTDNAEGIGVPAHIPGGESATPQD